MMRSVVTTLARSYGDVGLGSPSRVRRRPGRPVFPRGQPARSYCQRVTLDPQLPIFASQMGQFLFLGTGQPVFARLRLARGDRNLRNPVGYRLSGAPNPRDNSAGVLSARTNSITC